MTGSVTLLKSNLSAGGGLEKYTLYIASALLAKGHPVTLLTNGKPYHHPLLQGIDVHYLGERKKPSFRDLLIFDANCRNFLKQNPSDVVFGLDRNAFQTHYRAGNGCHAAFLERRKKESSFFKRLTFHLNPLHRTLLDLERKTFENPKTQIFTNSGMVREEILRHYNANPENLRVIYNGVEWEAFEPAFNAWPEKKKSLCQKYALDPNAFQLLFAGHGFHRKGLKPLLRAVKRLEKYDLELSVIGKDKDKKSFETLAQSLGLSKKVKFFGQIESVTPFYQLADALVLPTFYDPFANVTLEAAAMGLYVVTSINNGAAEILDPNHASIVEDPFSPQEIAKGIISALENPKTFPTSKKVREKVKPFDFSTQLDKMLGLLFADMVEDRQGGDGSCIGSQDIPVKSGSLSAETL